MLASAALRRGACAHHQDQLPSLCGYAGQREARVGNGAAKVQVHARIVTPASRIGYGFDAIIPLIAEQ